MMHETAPRKNRIILGVMNIGPDPSSGARITSLDEYNAILDYLQSQGYNEIDTAQMYLNGKQEPFTAAAHWKARGLQIATKVGLILPLHCFLPVRLPSHLDMEEE
jgi:aflatoxin B1 aldehyde reductase